MEFLTPAPVGVLLVEGGLLRFGRRSCVVDMLIRRPERDEPIAHAVVTYAPVFPNDRPKPAQAVPVRRVTPPSPAVDRLS